MSKDTQVWRIPVTPAQRWALFNLSHNEANKVQGQESRKLRRFLAAFKIDVIRDALAKNDQRVSTQQTQNRAPAMVTITLENRDYALHIDATVARSASADAELGDLWDALDATKDGSYVEPTDIPDYGSGADDWTPPSDARADALHALAHAAEKASTEAIIRATEVLRG